MLERAVFAYVVGVDGVEVTLNLRSEHRGSVASHRYGISQLLEIGSLFGVVNGVSILVLRVQSLQFTEPREVHAQSKQPAPAADEPLRHLKAKAVGRLIRRLDTLEFFSDALTSPPLGAEAFPLTDVEMRVIHSFPTDESPMLKLGRATRGLDELRVPLNRLLPRHVAVLGGTGQGKSCFTAAMLQQMVAFPKCRIVVFDINGEYADALTSHCSESDLKVTRLGVSGCSEQGGYRIPYYALGRAGLSRLLLPSEKTQRPAFNFAMQALPYVEYIEGGVGLAGVRTPCLFDDCRPGEATEALAAIQKLRDPRRLRRANQWPPMAALASLIADSQCVKKDSRGNATRDAFQYGSVGPLITRIHRRIDDAMFRSVIDVNPAAAAEGSEWNTASERLVHDFFGAGDSSWKIHIVDLRRVMHDLLPGILGALLELYAWHLFERGQAAAYPTLLVLEEAHHYLRSIRSDDESAADALAYERLAKEGRKFGLSLWISTQRPSEVSPTVLTQCGTWVCFRVTGSADMNAIGDATEWLDRRELSAISGLPRQQAMVFGAGVPLPSRIVTPDAHPKPRSHDPDYSKWSASGGTLAQQMAADITPAEVAADAVPAKEPGRRRRAKSK